MCTSFVVHGDPTIIVTTIGCHVRMLGQEDVSVPMQTQVDTGLTNGTTYYYVVNATNSVGSSANSAEISVTPAGAITAKDLAVQYKTNSAFHTINPVKTGADTYLEVSFSSGAGLIANHKTFYG